MHSYTNQLITLHPNRITHPATTDVRAECFWYPVFGVEILFLGLFLSRVFLSTRLEARVHILEETKLMTTFYI